MSVNGTVTTLRAGDYEARVAGAGASLMSLTRRGRDLVLPFQDEELADGYQGRTLVPWPNRVVGGRYEVHGRVLHLPVNERATGAALHGDGAFQQWTLVDVAEDGGAAAWELDLPATYGYPFDVVCRVEMVLDAQQGLGVVVTGVNHGTEPAPFGAATHPYLTCGRPLDECTLVVPADRVLLTDERSTPTEVVPVRGDLDLRDAQVFGARRVDHAFSGLATGPDGEWAVELTHPEGAGVRLTSTAPWVQVYSAEKLGRRGAAVEAMTCPPDAFNQALASVLLEPGESRSMRLRISAV